MIIFYFDFWPGVERFVLTTGFFKIKRLSGKVSERGGIFLSKKLFHLQTKFGLCRKEDKIHHH